MLVKHNNQNKHASLISHKQMTVCLRAGEEYDIQFDIFIEKNVPLGRQ